MLDRPENTAHVRRRKDGLYDVLIRRSTPQGTQKILGLTMMATADLLSDAPLMTTLWIRDEEGKPLLKGELHDEMRRRGKPLVGARSSCPSCQGSGMQAGGLCPDCSMPWQPEVES